MPVVHYLLHSSISGSFPICRFDEEYLRIIPAGKDAMHIERVNLLPPQVLLEVINYLCIFRLKIDHPVVGTIRIRLSLMIDS